MRITVETKLEGYLTSAYLFLMGQTIYLAYDGVSTYGSTDHLDLPARDLDIVLRVYGFNGTEWSLALAIEDDEGNEWDWGDSGEIEQSQTDLLSETIELPE